MNCKTPLWLFFGVIFASPATASVFKCKDEQGTTVYSQFPCQNAETEEVNVGLPAKIDAEVCALAYDYGLEVAKRMRDGTAGQDEKAQLNGQFAGSIAALNLIDYVHSFKNQAQMTTDRVAELTKAKCTNGGLGKISAKDIPHRTAEDKEQDQRLATQKMQEQAMQISAIEKNRAAQSTPMKTLDPPKENLQSSSLNACESNRKKLEQVENSMRNGYSVARGERLKEQVREYKNLIRKYCV